MLLESSNPHILRRTCELVGRLARHESAAPAVLELNLSARIVSLMGVIELDTHSLVELARWEGDPLAFVKKADHILTLLELPSSRVRESTGDLQLISLLGDLDEAIRNNVISALEAISESPDGPGVACLIAMDIERLTRLSHDQSLDPESQVRIRKIRDNVAQHQAGRALQLQEIPVRAADNSWSHGTMPPLDGVRVEIARFRSN
ncbi:hypothetical protein K438DRAFT_1825528 [Mycena galopus ATCC 62051]|nr:hypothetical protein K438DRAFT_1825528 [Mycena galopus ATCC 62051]